MNKRMVFEEWCDHLVKMRSRVEPVRCAQRELKFDNVDNLCQAVSKIGFMPVDPSKCEIVIPSVTVKELASMRITLKDKNVNPITGAGDEISVFVKTSRGYGAVQVKPIEEVGEGIYEVPFTANECGYYTISITVDGRHILGSPYRYGKLCVCI